MEAALTLLGVGGGTAIALTFLFFVIRGAIATAIEQAGKAEITRLDAALKDKLAERRHDFERDLEASGCCRSAARR